ncbi:GTP pyrophosphokinase [Listeria ilorinensis]|uniref:GTP pyrophosphokinase n=1 Tax=Listeria ilorinensis TaxID=2867439 RepID=UPI001EF6ACCD|nr:GTP pyrophosphokinase family protein [Listeria ilorinensis]
MENQEVMREFQKWLGDNPNFEQNMAFLDEFQYLMMYYRSAIKEVQTKLEILADELSFKNKRHPIHSIESRIKKPRSIGEKLIRKNKEITIENIRNELRDIAGIRVICSYTDDIYTIVNMLTLQDDIVLIETKDYIKHPKESGYRSLHIIISIPIFLSNQKEYIQVEIQIRTIAMDYWASLEHSLRYKGAVPSEVFRQLEEYAVEIADIEEKMLHVRRYIEK